MPPSQDAMPIDCNLPNLSIFIRISLQKLLLTHTAKIRILPRGLLSLLLKAAGIISVNFTEQGND